MLSYNNLLLPRKTNDHVVKKEFYPNGKLKSKITYINDTVKDGEALYYDTDACLTKLEYYKNDKNDSIIIEYNRGEKIKKVKVLYKNYPISFYDYYNGIIEHYTARSFEGRMFYAIDYDSIGKKIYEEGFAICPSYGIKGWGRDSGKSNLMYVGDTLGLTFLIAEPPHYYPQIFLWMYKVNSLADTVYKYGTLGKRIYKQREYDTVLHSAITFSNVFKEKGIYQIICAGIVRDSTSSFKKTDTVSSIWKVE